MRTVHYYFQKFPFFTLHNLKKTTKKLLCVLKKQQKNSDKFYKRNMKGI